MPKIRSGIGCFSVKGFHETVEIKHGYVVAHIVAFAPIIVIIIISVNVVLILAAPDSTKFDVVMVTIRRATRPD